MHGEGGKWVVAVPLDCGWSDLGSWDALWQVAGPDAQGNAVSGEAFADRLPRAPTFGSEEATWRLVGLGLKDVVAVAMRDAVLVADKSRAQDVKAVVATLRAAGKVQADDYPRFHRPWGWYETLCLADALPGEADHGQARGASCPCSRPVHRSEHWIVVAGTPG